jgi:hypothetical protein
VPSGADACSVNLPECNANDASTKHDAVPVAGAESTTWILLPGAHEVLIGMAC